MTKRNLNFGLDSYKSIISKFTSPVLILGHTLNDASKQKYDSERGWEIWAYILILEFFCFLVLEARKFHFRNQRNLERLFLFFGLEKLFPEIWEKYFLELLESSISESIRNFLILDLGSSISSKVLVPEI